MKSVSEKNQIDPVPEELQNFRTVREWLDLNSGTELGFDQDRGKNDDLADVPEDLREQMQRLKEACKAMSVSHQKDTTLDYDIAAADGPKIGDEAQQLQPGQHLPEQSHQETTEAADVEGIEDTLSDSLTVDDAVTIEQAQEIEIVI